VFDVPVVDGAVQQLSSDMLPLSEQSASRFNSVPALCHVDVSGHIIDLLRAIVTQSSARLVYQYVAHGNPAIKVCCLATVPLLLSDCTAKQARQWHHTQSVRTVMLDM
jgi:hypothetical protein